MAVYDRSDLPEDRIKIPNPNDYENVKDRFRLLDIDDINEKPDFNNHINADRLLRAIQKSDAEIKDYKIQQENSNEFYNRKIKKIEESVKYIRGILQQFLSNSDKKTLSLPNGTLRQRNIKKFHWDVDDSILVDFCHENKVPIIVNTKPDKKELKKYIIKTGDTPQGVYIEEIESFTYKTNEGG